MDNQGIIINVGRQIGSGGGMIARKLAVEFGCKLYDKELLNLAAKESGFCEKFFEQNDEQKGFLKSLFHIHVPLLGENNFYRNNFSQESLYQFQSDAIRKAADGGSCVFVGRTADYILRKYKNTVNIFVTANINQRLQRVCKRHSLTRGEARKYIHKHEEDRASYYNSGHRRNGAVYSLFYQGKICCITHTYRAEKGAREMKYEAGYKR